MDVLTPLMPLLSGGPQQAGRLLRLHTALGADRLVAETLDGVESVDAGGFALELTALSVDAHLELPALLGQPVLLELLTAESATALRPFHGHVTAFECIGSNGGLARYRLRIEPWLALLRQRLDSYVFHDMSVVEIVEDLFSDYAEQGALVPAWRWELADRAVYPRRSLTTQYQESDFDFLQRLLAEEGICYWFEHQAQPDSERFGEHTLVLADHNQAFAELGAVRFHRSDASERQDSIGHWHTTGRAQTARLSRASWDHRTLDLRPASAQVTRVAGLDVEDDDTAGPYAWHDSAQGQRRAQRQLEALQVSAHTFTGQGSWRQLAPGACFELTQHPNHQGEASRFTCLQVRHHGRNNLGAEVSERSEALLGAAFAAPVLPEPLRGLGCDSPAWQDHDTGWEDDEGQTAANHANHASDAIASATQALALGDGFYRNRFQAIAAEVPYRPQTRDGHGLRRHPKPLVHGTQTAIVVGDGGPVHTDRDHRIKVQFHWQRGANPTSGQPHPGGDDNAPGTASAWTWVRVATPWAGDNWGGMMVPRVGQEVLVAFLEGDIDRPVVIGALYNGQGNADAAHNRISGGGAGATGNAPAWFEGNEHAAVYTGLKSQALADSQGGSGGYQQLRLDDTPAQGRAQASTTQHNSTVTLGHLKGGQDNVRSADRGFGAELSTQASGALRAGAGLLLSTEAGMQHLSATTAQQQLAQSEQLLQTLAETAHTQTAILEADPEILPAQESLQALQESLRATQSGGAAGNGIAGGEGQAPGWSTPVLLGSGTDGIVSLTPQDQVWVSGTQTVLTAEQDLNWFSQGQTVMAVAGGIVLFTHGGDAPQDKPHQETGIALHAAQGKVSARAHRNLARLAAQDSITIASTQADIDIDAKKHVLLTAAGAYLKLEGGDIELGAPGTIEFKATQKVWTGPKSVTLELPKLPEASLAERPIKFALRLQDVPGSEGHPLSATPWKIVKSAEKPQGMGLVAEESVILQGETDDQGKVKLEDAAQELLAREYCRQPGGIWLMYPGQAMKISVVEEREDWSEDEKLVSAMSAAGFSPDVRSYAANTLAVGEMEYAMESLGEISEAGIAGKLDT